MNHNMNNRIPPIIESWIISMHDHAGAHVRANYKMMLETVAEHILKEVKKHEITESKRKK